MTRKQRREKLTREQRAAYVGVVRDKSNDAHGKMKRAGIYATRKRT